MKLHKILLFLFILAFQSSFAVEISENSDKKKNFSIELGGILGKRNYDDEAVSDIAQSKYGYGFSSGLFYKFLSKPRSEIGITYSCFFDYAKWRSSWEYQMMANQGREPLIFPAFNGDRKKYSSQLTSILKLFLFKKSRIINPFISAGFGYFWAKYDGEFYWLDFIYPSSLNSDKNYHNDLFHYNGFLMILNSGIQKFFNKSPIGFSLKLQKYYYIVREQTNHLPKSDEDFNYFSLSIGIIWRYQ